MVNIRVWRLDRIHVSLEIQEEFGGTSPMIFKDDVVYLIDEYTAQFGQAPRSVTGSVFPRRCDWHAVVRALRKSLDAGKPLTH